MNLQPILIFSFIPIYIILVYIFRKYREWLLYYLFGAFGFTLIITYTFNYFRLDEFLVAIEVFHTNIIANFLGIPSQALSYGRLQLPMKGGWSILAIGVECSAILEMSALTALLGFYPAFSYSQRVVKIIFGLTATYIINIFRMFIIVAMTYHLGINYVFIAHAVIGRLLFFILVIALYWLLMTKSTINTIGHFLGRGLKITETTILKEPFRLRSTLFMIFIPIFAIGLTITSFAKSDNWKTAFQRRIIPKEQRIAGEATTKKPEPETEPPNIKEKIGHGKIINLTPEVLGEKKEGINLIPAITALKTENKWLCLVRKPQEHREKEFYYLWLNAEDGQEITIGPTKQFTSKIRGFEDDKWQCFVATDRKELEKLRTNK